MGFTFSRRGVNGVQLCPKAPKLSAKLQLWDGGGERERERESIVMAGTHGTVTWTSLIGKGKGKQEISFISFQVTPLTTAIPPSSPPDPLSNETTQTRSPRRSGRVPLFSRRQRWLLLRHLLLLFTFLSQFIMAHQAGNGCPAHTSPFHIPLRQLHKGNIHPRADHE